MREMKNSGIEWIGITPLNWIFERGKYMFTQRNMRGNSFDLQLLSPTQKYGVIPQSMYESLTGMNAVKLNEHTDLSLLKTIHKGDFCISLRSFQGGFEYSDYEGVVSPAYQVFYPIVPLYSGYYKYLFKDMCFIEKMNSYTMTLRDGKNIAFADFGSTYIPFPPLPEQKAIATYLDAKCAEIDALTADIQAQIDTLEQYKQSVITEAVTKGLNPDAEMKDSGVQWIGNIPSHWKCIRGKYILNYIQKPIKEDDGVITCFRDGEVTLRSNRREDGFTMADKEIGYQGIDIGDLVVHGMDGFAGAIGISDSRGKASPVLNVLETEQNKRYIMYFLRSMAYSDVFLALATGIRVRSCDLRWNKLAELIYPVPTLEEQNSIVEYIDSVIQKTDIIINEKQEQLETLESYKKSLIYEYVTGKKEVPAAESDVIAVIFDPELVQAYIAHKLGKDNEKGKVYSHKVKYMVDYHIGLGLNIAYTRNYRGPHDVNLDTYIDSIISKGWYRKQKKDGAEILVKGKNYTDFINNHSDIFNQYESDIDNLIKYLKTLTRGQIERIATLYAVWNDFIIDGKTNPTEEEIITEVVTNWTKNKANFQHTTWQESLNQMKQHGIIPKGQGLHTIVKA